MRQKLGSIMRKPFPIKASRFQYPTVPNVFIGGEYQGSLRLTAWTVTSHLLRYALRLRIMDEFRGMPY